MKSKYNSLNISLTIVITIILIYFFYINYSHSNFIDGFKRRRMKIKKPSIKPKSIAKATSNVAKSTTKTAVNTSKNTAKTVAKSASKLSGPIKKAIKKAIDQSTKPITSVLKIITNQLKAVTKVVTNLIKGIKSGVVTPLVNVFKYIGLMFSQLGLLIFDFLLQIAQIPTCLISYIIWIIMTLKEQVIMAIIFPIIQKILKKIFGRFYPATIIGYFIKFLNWFINFHFYILSLIGSFFGITDLFYKEKCFNFTGNFKKRIDNMKKHLIDAGNSFTQFGKFDF